MSDYANPNSGSMVIAKTDWRDPKSIADAIRHIYGMRRLKEHLEGRTARNCAFFDGRQQYEWSPGDRRLVIPEKYRQAADFLMYNVIRPLMYQKLSKVSRLDRTWTVPSHSSTERDQAAARLSNDLMKYHHDYGVNAGAKVEEFLRWYYCSPVTFIEPYWDAVKGDLTAITLDDFYQDIPEGMPPEEADRLRNQDLEAFRGLIGYQDDARPVMQFTGDIGLRIRSIFNMMWYPFQVTTWEQVHAYVDSEVMAPEEVAHRYTLKIDDVLRWRGGFDEALQFQRINNGWTSPFMDGRDFLPGEDDGVLVRRFFADRVLCPPYGHQSVLIGNAPEVINAIDRLDNPLGELPFLPEVAYPSNGTAWGYCHMDDVVPAQMELNDTRTELARYRRKKLRPTLIKDKTDGGEMEALESGDAIYECNAEKKPSFLTMPDDKGIDMEISAFNLDYIKTALSTPDVSLGRREPGITAARAIIAMQEEAATRNEHDGKKLNRLWAKVGTHLHALLQHKATGNRITPIIGQNNEVEYRLWTRRDIRPQALEQYPSTVTIVQCTVFTNLPTTPAEMRQLVMSLFEVGVFRPGVHDRLVAEVFGLNDFRTVLDRGRIGRDQQAAEIERWKAGEPIQIPQETDDHIEHIEVLKPWVSTDEFRRFAAQFPVQAQQVLEHLDIHEIQKHEVQATEQVRAEFAQMRAAAVMAQKAAESGMVGAYMRFRAVADGLVPLPTLGQPDASTQDQRGTSTPPKQKEKSHAKREPSDRMPVAAGAR